jgi:hypothetical protein
LQELSDFLLCGGDQLRGACAGTAMEIDVFGQFDGSSVLLPWHDDFVSEEALEEVPGAGAATLPEGSESKIAEVEMGGGAGGEGAVRAVSGAEAEAAEEEEAEAGTAAMVQHVRLGAPAAAEDADAKASSEVEAEEQRTAPSAAAPPPAAATTAAPPAAPTAATAPGGRVVTLGLVRHPAVNSSIRAVSSRMSRYLHVRKVPGPGKAHQFYLPSSFIKEKYPHMPSGGRITLQLKVPQQAAAAVAMSRAAPLAAGEAVAAAGAAAGGMGEAGTAAAGAAAAARGAGGIYGAAQVPTVSAVSAVAGAGGETRAAAPRGAATGETAVEDAGRATTAVAAAGACAGIGLAGASAEVAAAAAGSGTICSYEGGEHGGSSVSGANMVVANSLADVLLVLRSTSCVLQQLQQLLVPFAGWRVVLLEQVRGKMEVLAGQLWSFQPLQKGLVDLHNHGTFHPSCTKLTTVGFAK